MIRWINKRIYESIFTVPISTDQGTAPLPLKRSYSMFITTGMNQAFYTFTDLIVLPTYITAMLLTLTQLFLLCRFWAGESWQLLALPITTVGVIGVAVIIANLVSERYWFVNRPSRMRVSLICVYGIVIFGSISAATGTNFVQSVWMGLFLLYLLFATLRIAWQWRLRRALLLTLLLVFGLGVVQLSSVNLAHASIVVGTIFIVLGFLWFKAWRKIQNTNTQQHQNQPYRVGQELAYLVVLLVIVISLYFYSSRQLFIYLFLAFYIVIIISYMLFEFRESTDSRRGIEGSNPRLELSKWRLRMASTIANYASATIAMLVGIWILNYANLSILNTPQDSNWQSWGWMFAYIEAVTSPSVRLFASFLLVAMLLVAEPGRFIRQQLGHFRDLIGQSRQAYIQGLVSNTVSNRNGLTRFFRFRRYALRVQNQRLWLPLSVGLGAALFILVASQTTGGENTQMSSMDNSNIPSSSTPTSIAPTATSSSLQQPAQVATTNSGAPPSPTAGPISGLANASASQQSAANPVPAQLNDREQPIIRLSMWLAEFAPLILNGIVGGILFGFGYLLIYLYSSRQKHIVLPFVIPEKTENNTELQAVRERIRSEIVAELKRIGVLLSLRNVADTSTTGEETLAFFTTGNNQEQQIVEQFSQLGEVPDFASWIFSPLLALVKSTARTRLSGQVYQRQGTTIDVDVTLSLRSGQSFTASKTLSPATTNNRLTNTQIREAARRIAIELVIKLGQVSHIATTEESFALFLKGLEASQKRRWWVAIHSYRQAARLEREDDASPVLINYYLGISLMYQGEFQQGLAYLQSAANSGTPLPEVEYALALAKSFVHWDELHLNQVIFRNIVNHCKQAATLRPQFPEVYHLLGSVYYRCARLQHRLGTRNYTIKPERLREAPVIGTVEWNTNYQRAAHYLEKSLHQYDRKIRQLPIEQSPRGDLDREFRRLVHDRLIATHNLADTLRFLNRFEEADTYYGDFLAGKPRNMRTLVDRTQNYCLARSWQRAEEYLRRDVFVEPEAEWNAHANFYMGWALAGGLTEEFPSPKTYPLVRWMIFRNKQIYRPAFAHHQRRVGVMLIEAMAYMDFALHQRARFIYTWAKTDWQDVFSKAVNNFANLGSGLPQNVNKKFLQEIYDTSIDPDAKPQQISAQVMAWLALRIESYNVRDRLVNDPILSFIYYPSNGLDKETLALPHEPLKEAYNRFQELREQCVELLKDTDQSGQVSGLQNTYRRLCIAEELQTNLKDIYNEFVKLTMCHDDRGENWCAIKDNYKILKRSNLIRFKERWVFDFYAEAALLTCRMLAETRYFEVLESVASETVFNLSVWLHGWADVYNGDETSGGTAYPSPLHYFNFTHRVTRYQLATLRSWRDYGKLMALDDTTTQLRQVVYDADFKPLSTTERNRLATEIFATLGRNQRRVNPHVLTIYVRALLMREQQALNDAVVSLERLLKLIAPFDPLDYIGNWETKGKGRNTKGTVGRGSYDQELQLDERMRWSDADPPRSRLRYYERVAGYRQFEDIIDKEPIHGLLAEMLGEIGDRESSVDHTLQALIWSPYSDRYFDNFRFLAQRLFAMDRFPETRIIAEEAAEYSARSPRASRSTSKRLEFRALRCMMDTRLEDYTASARQGELLLDELLNVRQLNENHHIPYNNEYFKRVDSRLKEKFHEDPNSPLRHIYRYDLYYRTLVIFYLEAVKDKIAGQSISQTDTRLSEDISIDIYYALSDEMRFSDTLKDVFSDYRNRMKEYNGECEFEHEEYKRGFKYSHEYWTEHSRINPGEANSTLAIMSHIFHFMARNARRIVEQRARLLNNLAYNYAQLRRNQDELTKAIELVDEAIMIVDAVQEHTGEKGGSAYEWSQMLSLVEMPDYYDTKGWISYRQAINMAEGAEVEKKLEHLTNARQIIEQNGLQARRTLEISYYHLARIHLSILRVLWQKLNTIELTDEQQLGLRVSMDTHLRLALSRWDEAQQRDINGRLSERLNLLRQRIEVYRENWDQETFK